MRKLEHILHSRTELNLEAIALMGQMQASPAGCSHGALRGFTEGVNPAMAVEAASLPALVRDRSTGHAQ